MKGFAIAMAAALAVSASPVFAQAQAPAAGSRPAPAAGSRPAPAAPAPAAPPAQAAPAPQAPPPPAPFPVGAKVGFVNLQAIAQLSSDGKAAAAKVNALAQKKQTEAADKAKALQANQQKLETSGSVMSEAARAQLQKDIDRQTVEGQRFEQDAQQELTELQQQLQQDFQAKLMPVLEALSKEKGLQVLFSAGDSGVIWAEPGIDLTLEAVARLDKSAAPNK
ncbi:MAG: OmpH family outer membrane protein [Acidobacteria bacterium]|nr:OmpH family outer membrane protein [Acidobacteriota bacterium]